MRKLSFSAVAAVALVGLAGAETLTWTGSTDASNGNKWFTASTPNWTNESGTAVRWTDGNDARFDDGTALRTVLLDSTVRPKTITVDIDADMMFTNTSGNATIRDCESFTKLGAGTLWLKPKSSINSSTNTVHVRGGTLKGSLPNNAYLFGSGNQGVSWQAFVYGGATLWVAERNSLANANTTALNHVGVTVYTNGVLSLKNGEMSNNNINSVTTLDLLGGSIVMPDRGAGSYGFLRVNDRFLFGENPTGTPYAFDPIVPWSSTPTAVQECRLVIGTNTEFRVADITGDSDADVTVNVPLVAGKAWETDFGPCGYRKTGPGKMVLGAPYSSNWKASTEVTRPNGPISVESGELEILEPYVLAPRAPGAIRVGTNATLTVHGNMFVNADCAKADDDTALLTNVTYRPVAVDHGTLALKGSVAHYAFGDLTLDHATIDFSEATGSSSFLTVLSLLGKITLDGDEPIVFSDAMFPNAASGCRKISLSAANTEFCVADIVESETEADFRLSSCLRDQRSVPHSFWARSGFVKTGPGLMQVDCTQNDFTGNVEVREGTLAVGLIVDALSAGGYRRLGSFRTEGRSVSVSGTGTLWFPERNEMTYGYAVQAITNATAAANYPFTDVRVDGGGTLKCTQHEHFDKLTFSNGGRLRGYGANGGYGIFTVFRKFTVSGRVASAADAFSDGGDLVNDRQPDHTGILLNGEPTVEFDIADTTGDGEPDATFHRALAIGYLYKKGRTVDNPPTCGEWKFGFRKTGAGTMRLASLQTPTVKNNGVWPLNGTLAVEAGELRVDSDYRATEAVTVASGAFLSGTGTVNSVTLAAGGGVRVASRQPKALLLAGDLTVGANPVVDVLLPSGAEPDDVLGYALKVTGTVTGAENFANADVRVNGVATDRVRVRFDAKSKTLRARAVRGFALFLR